jgi:hypothetical protein
MCLMLLTGATVAHASEHYHEVWNPPEARHTVHASHVARHKPAPHRLSAKRSTKMKPSHMVASAPAPSKRNRAGRAVHINAGPGVHTLPPVAPHKRNVLRVDANGAHPEVLR